MTPPFGRAELDRCESELLSRGRFANAVVRRCRVGDGEWVVKDFRPKSWFVRNAYGRPMIRRELAALQRLAGVAGAPQEPFLLDCFALAYRYMPGRTLAAIGPGGLPGAYFEALERLAIDIHARGVAHLDLRYRQNVLVLDDGTPAVLDFQASVRLDRLPHVLRRLAEQVDFSGVYKHWLLRSSEPMDERRLAAYRRHARRRRLWVVRGYLIRPERSRRKGAPPELRLAGRA